MHDYENASMRQEHTETRIKTMHHYVNYCLNIIALFWLHVWGDGMSLPASQQDFIALGQSLAAGYELLVQVCRKLHPASFSSF